MKVLDILLTITLTILVMTIICVFVVIIPFFRFLKMEKRKIAFELLNSKAELEEKEVLDDGKE